MDNKVLTIDIVGNHNADVENQNRIINAIPHLAVKSHIVSDIANYFEKLSANSDIVIVNLSERALHELKSIEKANIHNKSIVVIGDKNNITLLSTAISVGITEFINQQDYQQELLNVANKIILNRTVTYKNTKKRKLNAIINAKGGGGASFIASNIAYLLSKAKDLNVALLDLDLQFGTIGLNFDVASKYTIVEALNEIDEIDHLSLEAYMVKYNDHLNMLLPSSDDIILPGEIQPEAIKSLLYLLQRNYNQIVIDLPRIIDPLSSTILEQADHITIVVQQTLAQYRDGRRLIQILNKDLDIPLEKIIVAINRYDSKNSLKKSDMVNIVNHDKVFTVANDFERAASTSNLGEPLCQTSPNSKIANDLKKLAMYLGDVEVNTRGGILDQFKSLFA
jgi:pilus assembly protein CpaE